MTKVLWLVEALLDLRGIKDYIAQDNPVAARRIVKAVRNGEQESGPQLLDTLVVLGEASSWRRSLLARSPSLRHLNILFRQEEAT